MVESTTASHTSRQRRRTGGRNLYRIANVAAASSSAPSGGSIRSTHPSKGSPPSARDPLRDRHQRDGGEKQCPAAEHHHERDGTVEKRLPDDAADAPGDQRRITLPDRPKAQSQMSKQHRRAEEKTRDGEHGRADGLLLQRVEQTLGRRVHLAPEPDLDLLEHLSLR